MLNGTNNTEQKELTMTATNEIFTYNSSTIQNNGTTFLNPKAGTFEIVYKADGLEGQLVAKGENEEIVRQDAMELFSKKGFKNIEISVTEFLLPEEFYIA